LANPVTVAVPTGADAVIVPAPLVVPCCSVTEAFPELLVKAVATGREPAVLLTVNVTNVFRGTGAPDGSSTFAVAVRLPPFGMVIEAAPVLVLVKETVAVPLVLVVTVDEAVY